MDHMEILLELEEFTIFGVVGLAVVAVIVGVIGLVIYNYECLKNLFTEGFGSYVGCSTSGVMTGAVKFFRNLQDWNLDMIFGLVGPILGIKQEFLAPSEAFCTKKMGVFAWGLPYDLCVSGKVAHEMNESDPNKQCHFLGYDHYDRAAKRCANITFMDKLRQNWQRFYQSLKHYIISMRLVQSMILFYHRFFGVSETTITDFINARISDECGDLERPSYNLCVQRETDNWRTHERWLNPTQTNERVMCRYYGFHNYSDYYKRCVGTIDGPETALTASEIAELKKQHPEWYTADGLDYLDYVAIYKYYILFGGIITSIIALIAIYHVK
jgi:hypothetical protein